jgi:hypothetical protein
MVIKMHQSGGQKVDAIVIGGIGAGALTRVYQDPQQDPDRCQTEIH